MDYKLLRAVAAVIQEGGFERAASVLHITQSAVSQRVKLLEDQLGKLVLTRTTPPMPTDAGLALMKHFKQVELLENELKETIDQDSSAWVTLPVGVNADSIATWFVKAVAPFVKGTNVLLDVRVEDQEQTHQLLRSGEVMGCVSDQKNPFNGCSVKYLGEMPYRLVASPDYMERWFSDGVTFEQLSLAPALIFGRKDDLHNKFIELAWGQRPGQLNAHYLPSSEKFVDYIISGITYGMLLDQQSEELIQNGDLVELSEGKVLTVPLYWHYWNFTSTHLQQLTKYLMTGAKAYFS